METYSAVDNKEKERELVVLNRKEQLRTKRGYWVLRRGQDILFSLLALLVLWPVMLIVALVVFIDDPHGSPIFSQERCGRDGRLFKMYKFRSMYVDAEDRLKELLKDNEMDGPAFKMKDDPRITRVGRVIRKVSLDELPQLFNIFLGQMSFVGPRPALWNQNDLIEQRDRYGANELTPGLTGLAQVNGRDELPIAVKAAYDGEYVKKIGLWTDIRILFATFFGVLKADGVVEGRVDDPPKTGAAKEETET